LPDETGCDLCGKGKKIGDGAGTHIQITGVIDYLTPDGVQDHKTTGAMKWAKSPKALGESIQMRLYGCELLHLRLHDDLTAVPLPIDKISLRHNIYCKDPDDLRVRKVETSITADKLTDFWNTFVIPTVTEMERYRRTANQYHDLPDPCNTSQACNAYGGCPFRSICGGQESEAGYEKRTTINVAMTALDTSLGLEGKGLNMAPSKFAAALAAKKAVSNPTASPVAAPAPALNPPAAAPAAAPAQAPAPAAAAPATVAPPVNSGDTPQPPPWANPNCPACKGLGFSARGTPCRICDAKATGLGKTPSPLYIIESLGDGQVMWQLRTDDSVAGVSPLAATAPVAVKVEEKSVVQVQVAAPEAAPAVTLTNTGNAPRDISAEIEAAAAEVAATVPAKAPVEAPVTATAATATSEPTLDTPEPQDGPGRPKKGFILCINCAPWTGMARKGSGRHVIKLSDCLARVGEQMAKENGKESFYQLDAFRRRDALAVYAPTLAKEFGADIVVALGVGTGQSDLKVLVDAIRPLAGMEIVAEAL
jgi:hypothetical protein